MVVFRLLDSETAEAYRKEIARFYYDNVRSNAFLGHYTYEEAYEKIGSLVSHLADGTATAYGAFEKDELCGFIWAYRHPFREEERMYVSEIRVKEEFRNQGIGTELLRLVEDKAKETGIKAMYLHAEANNTNGLRLYKRLGFKEERIQLRKYLG